MKQNMVQNTFSSRLWQNKFEINRCIIGFNKEMSILCKIKVQFKAYMTNLRRIGFSLNYALTKLRCYILLDRAEFSLFYSKFI